MPRRPQVARVRQPSAERGRSVRRNGHIPARWSGCSPRGGDLGWTGCTFGGGASLAPPSALRERIAASRHRNVQCGDGARECKRGGGERERGSGRGRLALRPRSPRATGTRRAVATATATRGKLGACGGGTARARGKGERAEAEDAPEPRLPLRSPLFPLPSFRSTPFSPVAARSGKRTPRGADGRGRHRRTGRAPIRGCVARRLGRGRRPRGRRVHAKIRLAAHSLQLRWARASRAHAGESGRKDGAREAGEGHFEKKRKDAEKRKSQKKARQGERGERRRGKRAERGTGCATKSKACGAWDGVCGEAEGVRGTERGVR